MLIDGVLGPLTLCEDMVIAYRFLALKPKTFLRDGRLTIDTPMPLRMVTLGAYRKTVVVDPDNRCISFSRRLLGKKTLRVVAFSEIERLDYSFDETGFDTDSPWLGSEDTTEWYTVGIVLKDSGEEIPICRIIGEGSVNHGWKGLLAGDDAIDCLGDQQERSLGLVKLLQAMTGLPLT